MASQNTKQLTMLEEIEGHLVRAINDTLAYFNQYIITAANIESGLLAFETNLDITTCHHLKYQKIVADKISQDTGLPEFADEKATDLMPAIKTQTERLIKYSRCCCLNCVLPTFEINLSITAKA